jgi:nitrogen fixation/metabolism regulation signal transduction histidine kinase
MKNGFSLGISGRLFALSIAISIALGALGVYAYASLHAAGELAKFTEENRVPQLQSMSELELNVTQVSLQLRHAILSRTPAERAETMAYIGAKRQHMDELLKTFESRLNSPEGRAHFTKLAPQLANFWRTGEANLALIQQDRLDEAFAFLVETTIPARNALLQELAAGREIQAKGLSANIERIGASVNNTSILIAGAAVLIAVSLLLFAWFVARTLRARVGIAQAAAERVRDGDLSQSVQDTQRDEVSPLIKALDDMQTSLTRVVGNVRQNADSVATASVQIAQGNSDLSPAHRTAGLGPGGNLGLDGAAGHDLAPERRQRPLASQLANSASTVASRAAQVVGRWSRP